MCRGRVLNPTMNGTTTARTHYKRTSWRYINLTAFDREQHHAIDRAKEGQSNATTTSSTGVTCECQILPAHNVTRCTDHVSQVFPVAKFSGRTSQIDAALLIADINANNTLLPCTLDHLGGLGYFFHLLLFGSRQSPPAFPLPPASLPGWSPKTFLTHPLSFAYQRSLHAPQSLLPHASRAWHAQTKKNTVSAPLAPRPPILNGLHNTSPLILD